MEMFISQTQTISNLSTVSSSDRLFSVFVALGCLTRSFDCQLFSLLLHFYSIHFGTQLSVSIACSRMFSYSEPGRRVRRQKIRLYTINHGLNVLSDVFPSLFHSHTQHTDPLYTCILHWISHWMKTIFVVSYFRSNIVCNKFTTRNLYIYCLVSESTVYTNWFQ